MWARFVRDVTVPDGTVLRPCETFIKTWRFRNELDRPWPAGTRLLFVGKNSDRLGYAKSKVLAVCDDVGLPHPCVSCVRVCRVSCVVCRSCVVCVLCMVCGVVCARAWCVCVCLTALQCPRRSAHRTAASGGRGVGRFGAPRGARRPRPLHCLFPPRQRRRQEVWPARVGAEACLCIDCRSV